LAVANETATAGTKERRLARWNIPRVPNKPHCTKENKTMRRNTIVEKGFGALYTLS